MIEDVAIFEQTAKQSWQSFSTMRRFVNEGVRLENVSWRLWFMQRNPDNYDSKDEIDVVHTKPISAVTKPYRPLCIYCEFHEANLSCNGCCHDVYCVLCFKLVHKKGNLATHTAIKIPIQVSEKDKNKNDEEEKHTEIVMTLHNQSLYHKKAQHDGHVLQGQKRPPVSLSQQSNGSIFFTKPWEVQMDMLLQRLMKNSLHNDLDISVHNIDARDMLGSDDSDTKIAALLRFDGCTGDTNKDANEKSNEAAVEAAVAAAGRHRVHSLTSEENGKVCSGAAMSLMATIRPSHSRGKDDTIEDIALSINLDSKNLPRTKSRRSDSQTCANCNGNHITVECPQLESDLFAPAPSTVSGESGVDTVLRKCFTTIHNSHMSNSAHAFLGDEASVRGGNNFANTKQLPSSNALQQMDRPSPFGMNVIAEDNLIVSDDIAPMLAELAVSNAGGRLHSWSADSWLLSCLATELPSDVFEQLRGLGRGDKYRPISTGSDPARMALTGWAYLKVPGKKWRKRFLSLYRNNLWEYLDANETSRPVGHANICEGSVHPQQRSTTELVLQYNCHASVLSKRNELWLKFDSEKDAVQWRAMIMRAIKLQIDDLFDLTPDSPTETCKKTSFELGKGRFSIVRRARRKVLPKDPSSSQHCALKIIEKATFWNLVTCETEREDTIVREILTQSLLTIRSGSSYCPVIRLQSLFETRDQLVMELELMNDGDLHDEIATKSAVDETRASFLIASLVQAIDYCQRNGVAHRDVKLSNLALAYERSTTGKEYPVIKVADFGMAAFIQPDGMLKGRCGTPGFVAPEILSAGKGEAYPSGVDIFSAGVVAYTMLCGYEPFFGVNDEELIQMNKRVEYEFEEPEWASISDEAKDMISLMMEKDPYKRVSAKVVLQHPFLRSANAALEDLFREQKPINLTRLL